MDDLPLWRLGDSDGTSRVSQHLRRVMAEAAPAVQVEDQPRYRCTKCPGDYPVSHDDLEAAVRAVSGLPPAQRFVVLPLTRADRSARTARRTTRPAP